MSFKKKVLIVLLAIVFLTGCGNYQMVDTKWDFGTAIVRLANGEVIMGRCESWKDFEDGDQIQVKIDGITYLVHSSNVTLIDGM